MKMRILQLGLGLLLTGILAFMLFRVVDVREIGAVLARADWRLIPLAMGIHVAAMWVRSLLWRRLLPSRPATHTLFQISVVGFAVNYVMPLRIGELVRLFLVKKWCRDDSGPVLASLVGERIFDGLTVSAILLLAVLFVPAPGYVVGFGLMLGAMFAGLAAIMVLARWRADLVVGLASFLARPLTKSLQSRVINLTHGFATNLGQFGGWRAVPGLIALAVSGWLAQFAVFYVMMFALPLHASIPEALLDGSMANFATLLPSAPGAVGAFDAALINLLVDIQGAPVENAAAYALLVHSVVVLPIVTLGWIFLSRSDLSLRLMLTPSRTPAPSTTSQHMLNVNGRTHRQNTRHVSDGLHTRRQTGELPAQ
jgi:uncharacterized protein (TIRG00374 family)